MDRYVIGFDRRVTLPWRKRATSAVVPADSLAEARAQLLSVLREDAGEEKDSDVRKNTVGVLTRLWVRVPPERRAQREHGLRLLERLEGRDRVMVHLGVAVASYPFFYDVASHLGCLIVLQEMVSQRMAEQWGAHSTVRRALQRVVRSMVDWGCLCETGEPGLF